MTKSEWGVHGRKLLRTKLLIYGCYSCYPGGVPPECVGPKAYTKIMYYFNFLGLSLKSTTNCQTTHIYRPTVPEARV